MTEIGHANIIALSKFSWTVVFCVALTVGCDKPAPTAAPTFQQSPPAQTTARSQPPSDMFATRSGKWEFVTESSEGDLTAIDRSTARRNGQTIMVWSLTNYAKFQRESSGRYYLSDISLYEINCRNLTYKIRSLTYYPSRGGGGSAVFSASYDDGSPVHIVPGSVIARVQLESCR